MSTMYDHDVAPKNDFFVDLAETAMSGLKYTVLPGSMLVNELPILRFIPTWFPGAGFKRIALEVKCGMCPLLLWRKNYKKARLLTASPQNFSKIASQTKNMPTLSVLREQVTLCYGCSSSAIAHQSSLFRFYLMIMI
ncbi:hypothetical protein BJ912DRAFT_116020 [Pholiota molesta]|nr:hypothetical protein BJ912DRAFT_116020 [Pholiota molesta]